MTYAEQVKAEVAARYGVPVLCDVHIIPRGVSSFDPTASKNYQAIREAQFAAIRRSQRLRVAEKHEEKRQKAKLLADMIKCEVALRAEMDALSRTVLSLRCEGKTHRQIAAETGRAVSQVHGILKRAIQKGLLAKPSRATAVCMAADFLARPGRG
ncbi:sigma-70 family RNA polymerase sigma factor [Paracoccus thiocyanatus]|uniref:Uncharacterized protein n=1 Tax=Paracoccus thiocyanatus TaxID=34006 RepID=A0A3D8PD67_9RHOB|nr:sigma-70 family RNA polymerase sigma factor [Paracoccus thiocyanatus]RDW13109.1 hypothetical protein DIE28_09955 [Paracoccus thiocyanatus]